MPATDPTYCPICGAELVLREESGRLRPVCDNCGYVHYVNPVPGVGMVIEMEGGLVLIRRGHPPHEGRWSLPSGFVEADESAEEAAIREAKEETGLDVEIIELANINSFPEGPPVSGIMIFYRMRPVGGEMCAGDDASEVRIFQPDDLPLLPFRTHREMIAEWLETRTDDAAGAAGTTPAAVSRRLPDSRIRLFKPDDMDEVLSLLALIPSNRTLSDEEWQAVRFRLLEAANVEVFVAETNTPPAMIVGFAALSVVRNLTDSVGLVGSMAVLPTYQRRGIGAELLEALMRRAHQLNLRALWVDTKHANDQARAFYAALGFDELDILRLRLS